jgi:hypothetical protein
MFFVQAAKEEIMRTIHAVARMWSRLVGSLQRPTFQCGQCERWQRCGQPPSNDCIMRAIQIARDADTVIPRARATHYWGNLGA